MRITKGQVGALWPESKAHAIRWAAEGAAFCLVMIIILSARSAVESRAAYKQLAETAELRAQEAESRIELYRQAVEYWADEAEAARSAQSVRAEYLGEYMCTAYCGEAYEHICGTGDGITASGAPVVAGVTCAAPADLPFGTVLYIEGVGVRIVQDRGGIITGNILDIAAETHAEALSWAGYGLHRVYILQAPVAEFAEGGEQR